MDKDEYLSAQFVLTNVAGMLNSVDLDAFLAEINRAETLGPILDPTLWIHGQEKLGLVKRLAQAALPLWRETKKQLAAQEKNK